MRMFRTGCRLADTYQIVPQERSLRRLLGQSTTRSMDTSFSYLLTASQLVCFAPARGNGLNGGPEAHTGGEAAQGSSGKRRSHIDAQNGPFEDRHISGDAVGPCSAEESQTTHRAPEHERPAGICGDPPLTGKRARNRSDSTPHFRTARIRLAPHPLERLKSSIGHLIVTRTSTTASAVLYASSPWCK